MDFKALQLVDLSKHFDGLTVLRKVSLQTDIGERLGLIGANGAGKSTILRLIGGWTRSDCGSVHMFGENVTNWRTFRRYAFGLREVPQFPEVSLELTGLETIAVAQTAPRLLQRKWVKHSGSLETNWVELPRGLVSSLELESPLDKLSFGSRKMLAIAAVIASTPRLLLLDEPTTGLDNAQRETLAALLSEMERCAVIIVEHDMAFIRKTCNRVVELLDGVVCRWDR